MENDYYVYVCSLKGSAVYVGKGKNDRYKHCLSGFSHNKKLNDAVREYGKDSFKVKIVFQNLTEDQAFVKERKTIEYFLDKGCSLYNNDFRTYVYAEKRIYQDPSKVLMIPYNLLSAGGYVNKQGECQKMTLTEKIIYAHIRNRFLFFKGLGKEYFDTQKSIADVCNMDIKAVGNVLRKFIKDDLTTIYKKQQGNYLKNVYVSVPPLTLWWKGEKPVEPEIYDTCDYDKPKDFVVDMPDIVYGEDDSRGVDLFENGEVDSYFDILYNSP